MARLRALGTWLETLSLRWRWTRIGGRAFARARKENLTDMGGTLAYFSILSIFPFVIVLVGLLGVFGSAPKTTDALLRIIQDLGPRSAADTFHGPVESVVKHDASATAALGFGIVFALYTASSYVGAFIRAANRIFEVEEGREFWRRRPLQLAVTLATVLLLGVTIVALVVSGPIAKAVGEQIGLNDGGITIYNIAKWPAVLFVLIAVVGMLYGTSPNVRRVRHRFVSPGCLWSVGIWLAGSAAFTYYVSNFARYDKTYGSIAGLIVFLIWIWLSNLALLVGLLIDAEIERERELEAGLPAEDELQLPPRTAAN
jgi:membrane protein